MPSPSAPKAFYRSHVTLPNENLSKKPIVWRAYIKVGDKEFQEKEGASLLIAIFWLSDKYDVTDIFFTDKDGRAIAKSTNYVDLSSIKKYGVWEHRLFRMDIIPIIHKNNPQKANGTRDKKRGVTMDITRLKKSIKVGVIYGDGSQSNTVEPYIYHDGRTVIGEVGSKRSPEPKDP